MYTHLEKAHMHTLVLALCMRVLHLTLSPGDSKLHTDRAHLRTTVPDICTENTTYGTSTTLAVIQPERWATPWSRPS